jgi:hypothetical protein
MGKGNDPNCALAGPVGLAPMSDLFDEHEPAQQSPAELPPLTPESARAMLDQAKESALRDGIIVDLSPEVHEAARGGPSAPDAALLEQATALLVEMDKPGAEPGLPAHGDQLVGCIFRCSDTRGRPHRVLVISDDGGEKVRAENEYAPYRPRNIQRDRLYSDDYAFVDWSPSFKAEHQAKAAQPGPLRLV